MKRTKLILTLAASISALPISAQLTMDRLATETRRAVEGQQRDAEREAREANDKNRREWKSARELLSYSQTMLADYTYAQAEYNRVLEASKRIANDESLQALNEKISELRNFSTTPTSPYALSGLRPEDRELVIHRDLERARKAAEENWQNEKKGIQEEMTKALDAVMRETDAASKLEFADEKDKKKAKEMYNRASRLKASITRSIGRATKSPPADLEELSGLVSGLIQQNKSRVEESREKSRALETDLRGNLEIAEKSFERAEGWLASPERVKEKNRLDLIREKFNELVNQGKLNDLKADFLLGDLRKLDDETGENLDAIKEILASNESFIESVKRTPIGVAITKIAQEEAKALIAAEMKKINIPDLQSIVGNSCQMLATCGFNLGSAPFIDGSSRNSTEGEITAPVSTSGEINTESR